MILVCGAVYCKDYSFSTDKVSVTLTQEDKSVYFSSIINKNTNTECIRKEIGKKNNIWAFQVKKSREYASDPIDMLPTDAEKLTVKNGNKIVLTWKNVKKTDWKSGFDVIVTGEKSNDETLWHIKINSKTEDWGIWQVNFPFVTVKFEDGDEAFCGLFGGDISHENKPGKRISGHGYNDLPWCPYPVGDMPMQLFYFTQKGSGVYLCPEDTEGWHKHFKAPALGDKEVEYNLELYPNDQGVGGVSYSQAYKFNICAFDGDWFDGVKKYRVWGIKAGAAPFANGRIADRKDFPEWVKKNVYWGNDYQKLITGNVETAFHLYAWWNWPHDEGYPEMLPAKMTSLQPWLNRFEKANQNFVFYTNCHLIDTAASELYKKYGDSIVNLDEKLERKKFHWGTGSNAAT
ncbi:MAG: hypothetical protein KBT47_00620, partial [Armatimonadetes bacterium]|nr:hypothetical protein [Candidatus Hippobium faecium]